MSVDSIVIILVFHKMFASHTLLTDSMGLKIDENLFAAIGNQSFYLTDDSCVKLPQKSDFIKVHGFAVLHVFASTRVLLLYRENQFSLYKYDINKKKMFQLLYEGETQDWINAAKFLKDGESIKVVLHMAHSALLYLGFDDSKDSFGGCSIIEQACSTDYSMLYHTSLYGLQYKKLFIISGNGFGELLIWQPRNVVGIHSVTGSKIYPLRLRLKAHNGVIFAIDLNLTARLLVTTSDDRSLKFWQLNDVEVAGCGWNFTSVTPKFSCFGHSSRVISTIIVKHGDQHFIISGGEDSYICIWTQSGEMLFKRRQQFGAPIWRLGYDSSTATIYSTSSTGNFTSYNLHTVFKKKGPELARLKSLHSSIEFLKKIKFLNTSIIIGLSSKNRLFYMKLTKSSKMDFWKLVHAFPAYKCSILTSDNETVATCGFQRVTLLRYNDSNKQFNIEFDDLMLGGLIKSFLFLNKDTYLVSDEFGNCLIFKAPTLEIIVSFKTSNCREAWVTAALLIKPFFLLLSCRNGRTMLYSANESKHYELRNTIQYLHAHSGSNILQLLKNDDNFAYVLSGGHEPTLKHLRISYTDCQVTVMRREYIPLCWVEAYPAKDLFIGFNDNRLVAWSRKNDVLLELPCGGGHRSWDFQLLNNELHIIYVKQKSVFLYRHLLHITSPSRFLCPLQNSWHLQICNVIQLVQQKNENHPYFLSAGDDNIIKINKSSGQSFIQLAELHTHISSIRHLRAHPLHIESFSKVWLIFSVGGRAQICINQLDLNSLVVIELCSHTVRTNSDSKGDSIEARIMAIEVLKNSQKNDFSIFLASADGKIRLLCWQYEQPLEIHLINQINIERCPLHLKLITQSNLLLITSTDGNLYGFDHLLSSKYFRFQLHASGINSFDSLVKDNLLHVVSGGDDEKIKHVTIDLINMSIQSCVEFQNHHNAQVNGLTLFVHHGNGQPIDICAYTCSTDKQIFNINLTTQQFSRIGFTCISDVKGIVLYKNKSLYIYGSGLNIIEFKKKC